MNKQKQKVIENIKKAAEHWERNESDSETKEVLKKIIEYAKLIDEISNMDEPYESYHSPGSRQIHKGKIHRAPPEEQEPEKIPEIE